jgi:hypothetical protein
MAMSRRPDSSRVSRELSRMSDELLPQFLRAAAEDPSEAKTEVFVINPLPLIHQGVTEQDIRNTCRTIEQAEEVYRAANKRIRQIALELEKQFQLLDHSRYLLAQEGDQRFVTFSSALMQSAYNRWRDTNLSMEADLQPPGFLD